MVNLNLLKLVLINKNFRKYSNPWHYLASRYSSKVQSVKRVSVAHLLKSKIKATGPITVADYMKEVLTNPLSGYYMNRDVFGKEGDFVTSPEVSQMFGEMIAVWFVNQLQELFGGTPSPLLLVELGAGRGTMMLDILRVFNKLKHDGNMSCHLIEVSPALSQIQAEQLCYKFEKNYDETKPYYMHGISKTNVPVYWYSSFTDIPDNFSCIIAHEFFDALPIHKLQRTENGWREILVDIDPADEDTFRYVISRSYTPASMTYVKKNEVRDHIEVCPMAFVIMQQIAKKMEDFGGLALIADYGHNGTKTDTFRAFRNHSLHDPLVDPGTADLTADVDFNQLEEVVEDKLITYGPVSQSFFLKQMQIEARLRMLLEKCSDSQAITLRSGYDMLLDDQQMGGRFKFMSFFPLVMKEFLYDHPPMGFVY